MLIIDMKCSLSLHFMQTCLSKGYGFRNDLISAFYIKNVSFEGLMYWSLHLIAADY